MAALAAGGAQTPQSDMLQAEIDRAEVLFKIFQDGKRKNAKHQQHSLAMVHGWF